MGKLHEIYFSPGGTTKRIVNLISESMPMEKQTWDLLEQKELPQVTVDQEDIVIVGMPVYAGRIPALCVPMLARFSGNAPIILAVVYGNREYEDALVELKDIVCQQGFFPVAAGAFIARHSIFPMVAAGRPDEKDEEIIYEFSRKVRDILQNSKSDRREELQVKGNRPYREPGSVPMRPYGDKSCIKCGLCAKLCPTNAIPEDALQKTKKELCIACGACIYRCPVRARDFRGLVYKTAEVGFQKKCAARKEPELFYLSISQRENAKDSPS